MRLGFATPILRIFDTAKAHEFYVGFLGFEVQWEHRFSDDAPLYAEVSRGDCVLHLSEHHGDGTPGSTVRVSVQDIEAFDRELTASHYRFNKPDLCKTPWQTRELSVVDPFGNTLRFFEELPIISDGRNPA